MTFVLTLLGLSFVIALIVEGTFQFANMVWYVFFNKVSDSSESRVTK